MDRTRTSKVADASRKRKRGALQDISNNSTKMSQPQEDVSQRGYSLVQKEPTAEAAVKAKSKHPKAPRASTRRRSATASGLLTLESSKAAVAIAAAKRQTSKRVYGSKKTDGTRVKKRKGEGGEAPIVHQKVQTSILSFQAAAVKVKEETEESVETVEDVKVIKNKTGVVVDAGNDKEGETSLIDKEVEDSEDGREEKTREIQVVQKYVVHTTTPTAAVATSEPRDVYTPRPYTFTYDHKRSCFDKETYAATILDIDAPSATTSSHHAKLVRELDMYYRKHESKYLPEADYIGTVQMDINEKMRTILIDWLVEVGEEYKLDSQTFHKAVNLVDRCLKKIRINRKQFQLLGCACMMIAAKFDEVYGPNVEDFVYISDQTYTADEMLDMEAQVLSALEYRIASTTCYGFMHRYTQAGCATDKQRSLVSYLCDFALLYYHMVRLKPSKLVASAVYLARVTTGETEAWTPTLHHVTKYNPVDIQDCVEELHRLHSIESEVVDSQRDKAKAVSEKYLADKFYKASSIPACSKSQLTASFPQYKPS
uniref:Cyclin N-terminal domain-containing protein n=1 Tax=Hyaloperonospora arabidopsidis (strain Emoy2) TaxID=559515 RepID=M4BEU1_HYAAE